MALKTIRNLDIYVPNFDLMLLEKINTMTPDQRELIPPDLKFKIFKKKEASIEQMNFVEKMYLLSVCFKQSIIVATLDEDAGISVKDFNLALSAQKGKVKNVELLNNMQIPSLFVQSDKQLMQAWQYMSYTQTSEIYNLIKAANPTGLTKKELTFTELPLNMPIRAIEVIFAQRCHNYIKPAILISEVLEKQ